MMTGTEFFFFVVIWIMWGLGYLAGNKNTRRK